MKKKIQIAQLVNMNNPEAVLEEVKHNFIFFYPIEDFEIIRKVFRDFERLYAGKYPGYAACNTYYHDEIHVTDSVLAMSRLIDGYNLVQWPLPVRMVQLGLIAAILHDAGYIQTRNDQKGTGAKYTLHHVERSVAFVEKYFAKNSFSKKETALVGNMITCTDLMTAINAVPFQGKTEKALALMLGTADLLGQMASRFYLERLIFLYREFKEGHVRGFDSELGLLTQTLAFSRTIEKRLATSLEKMEKYAQVHFKERYHLDKNLYRDSMQNQIQYLKNKVLKHPKNYKQYLRRHRV